MVVTCKFGSCGPRLSHSLHPRPIRPDPPHHPPRPGQPDARSRHHSPIAVPRDGQPSSEHPMGARRAENPGQRRAHQPNGKRHFTNHSPAGTSVKIVFKCVCFSPYTAFILQNANTLWVLLTYGYFNSSSLQRMSRHRRLFLLTDSICYPRYTVQTDFQTHITHLATFSDTPV